MWWWWYWPLGCWRWISIVGSSPGHGNNGTRFFCVRVFFFSLLFIYFQGKCIVVVVVVVVTRWWHQLRNIVGCDPRPVIFLSPLTPEKQQNKKTKTKVEKWIIIIWFFGVFSNVQIVLAVINDMIFLVLFFFFLSLTFMCIRDQRESTDKDWIHTEDRTS